MFFGCPLVRDIFRSFFLKYNTVPYRYDIVRYAEVRYDTVPYGSVTLQYGKVKGDTWITKGNVVTKLIRSFELSKN